MIKEKEMPCADIMRYKKVKLSYGREVILRPIALRVFAAVETLFGLGFHLYVIIDDILSKNALDFKFVLAFLLVGWWILPFYVLDQPDEIVGRNDCFISFVVLHGLWWFVWIPWYIYKTPFGFAEWIGQLITF